MSPHRRVSVLRAAAVSIIAAGALALSACATPSADAPPPGASLDNAWPDPPKGEVVATGTVLDKGGDAELCVGPVAESWPPQCSGFPLEGWSWEGVEGSESSGDVTWGAYAVTGTFDGETFAVTQPPIMLALYDPVRPDDPAGGVEGETSEARLLEIQEELPSKMGDAYLSSYPDRGYLWVDVPWDDGTWQEAVDAEYGEKVVFINSMMREVSG